MGIKLELAYLIIINSFNELFIAKYSFIPIGKIEDRIQSLNNDQQRIIRKKKITMILMCFRE